MGLGEDTTQTVSSKVKHILRSRGSASAIRRVPVWKTGDSVFQSQLGPTFFLLFISVFSQKNFKSEVMLGKFMIVCRKNAILNILTTDDQNT